MAMRVIMRNVAALVLTLCCLTAVAVPDRDKVVAFEKSVRNGGRDFFNQSVLMSASCPETASNMLAVAKGRVSDAEFKEMERMYNDQFLFYKTIPAQGVDFEWVRKCVQFFHVRRMAKEAAAFKAMLVPALNEGNKGAFPWYYEEMLDKTISRWMSKPVGYYPTPENLPLKNPTNSCCFVWEEHIGGGALFVRGTSNGDMVAITNRLVDANVMWSDSGAVGLAFGTRLRHVSLPGGGDDGWDRHMEVSVPFLSVVSVGRDGTMHVADQASVVPFDLSEVNPQQLPLYWIQDAYVLPDDSIQLEVQKTDDSTFTIVNMRLVTDGGKVVWKASSKRIKVVP